VIPTFLIDEPALVFIGLFAGYFIPKGWQGSLFKTRAFLAGTVVTLGFMAIAAYGYAKAPDWMFMYFLPAGKVPFWMVVYLFIIYYVLYLAGFFLSFELRKIHPALALLALLVSIAASVGVVMPLMDQYQTIATFDEYYKGQGIPLSESEIGKSSTLPGIALVVVAVILFMWARRQKSA
jgi:hypothetical protein